LGSPKAKTRKARAKKKRNTGNLKHQGTKKQKGGNCRRNKEDTPEKKQERVKTKEITTKGGKGGKCPRSDKRRVRGMTKRVPRHVIKNKGQRRKYKAHKGEKKTSYKAPGGLRKKKNSPHSEHLPGRAPKGEKKRGHLAKK